MKAIWNDMVLAESEDIVTVEGNPYFPMDSIKKEFFKESETQTLCPWKGKITCFSFPRAKSFGIAMAMNATRSVPNRHHGKAPMNC